MFGAFTVETACVHAENIRLCRAYRRRRIKECVDASNDRPFGVKSRCEEEHAHRGLGGRHTYAALVLLESVDVLALHRPSRLVGRLLHRMCLAVGIKRHDVSPSAPTQTIIHTIDAQV